MSRVHNVGLRQRTVTIPADRVQCSGKVCAPTKVEEVEQNGIPVGWAELRFQGGGFQQTYHLCDVCLAASLVLDAPPALLPVGDHATSIAPSTEPVLEPL